MALPALVGAIGQLAGAGSIATQAVTRLASTITGGLLGPLESVRSLVGTIGQLVGLFNPGLMAQFQLVLNDTLAVIGSSLIPVLLGVTRYVRLFGDTLAALLPVIQPLFDAIGQAVADHAQGFLPIFQAAAPFIQLFADSMTQLLDKMATGMAFLQGIVAELIDTIAQLFGLESRFNANASSKGFAARQTKVSSVEQFANDLFASTAKNIYAREGGGKKPEALLAEIKKAIEDGRKVVEQIRDFVKTIADWFTAKVNIDKGLEAIEGGASNHAMEGIIRQFRNWINKNPW